ncbi:hypothetical protein SDC9_111645 [bioreactor metagenome]|uniref:Uncharacterized protein n=1 Tax=bioreactor metagenome TaxID=1076179 RepID=A0A645BHV7_9ZZZZ
MWAGFTGEKTAEEAKEKYERAKQRYEEFKSEFESKVEQITKSINETIIRINSLKTYYFDYLLVEFKHVISRVKGLQIKEHEELDGELIYTYEHDRLKGRSQIIKIDFDTHRFKNTVKAIITLGFATRKAANQSLQEAEAYDCSVSECIEKMKGELAKLENINIAILNVLSYFQCIINMAEHCIDRLKHSFAMLKNMHLVLSLPIVGGRYDGDRLPSVQLKTFELTHNLMKSLLKMSKSKYINANGDIQEGEVSAARKYASHISALPIAV